MRSTLSVFRSLAVFGVLALCACLPATASSLAPALQNTNQTIELSVFTPAHNDCPAICGEQEASGDADNVLAFELSAPAKGNNVLEMVLGNYQAYVVPLYSDVIASPGTSRQSVTANPKR